MSCKDANNTALSVGNAVMYIDHNRGEFEGTVTTLLENNKIRIDCETGSMTVDASMTFALNSNGENPNMNETNNPSTQEHDTIEKERVKHVLEGFRRHLTEPLSPFSILECETAIRAIETLEKIRDITANCLGGVDSCQDEPEESEYCEWIKYDYRTLVPRNHDAKNPYWRIPENMDKLKYCPYCGKEIKVVDD